MRTILLLIMTLTYVSYDASACSCVQPPPPGEAYALADFVAVVHVNKVEYYSYRQPGTDFDQCLARHEVTITQGFKGIVQENVVLESHSCDGASCGVVLEEGSDYLVYTYRQEGEALYELPNNNPRYMLHLCLRWRALANAADDLDSLRTLTVQWNADADQGQQCSMISTGTGWLLSCDREGADCFAWNDPVRIIDLLGREIAVIQGTFVDGAMAVSDAGLPFTPLWAIVGQCRLRLR